MRYKIGKNKLLSAGNYELTKADIESQAMADFRRYATQYLKKFGHPVSSPVDVDNFVEELWGVPIEYEEIGQPNPDELILGYFDPLNRKIVVDAEKCGIPMRVSFTVAHEAGHLALHSFLSLKTGDSTPKQREHLPQKNDPTWRLEWQANHYAASLLAPRQKIFTYFTAVGVIEDNVVKTPIDMNFHTPALQKEFGLSRQALEIRLSEFRLPMTNRRYP
jgi:Zn-dependent peptidase ImmA (M78 family)